MYSIPNIDLNSISKLLLLLYILMYAMGYKILYERGVKYRNKFLTISKYQNLL